MPTEIPRNDHRDHRFRVHGVDVRIGCPNCRDNVQAVHADPMSEQPSVSAVTGGRVIYDEAAADVHIEMTSSSERFAIGQEVYDRRDSPFAARGRVDRYFPPAPSDGVVMVLVDYGEGRLIPLPFDELVAAPATRKEEMRRTAAEVGGWIIGIAAFIVLLAIVGFVTTLLPEVQVSRRSLGIYLATILFPFALVAGTIYYLLKGTGDPDDNTPALARFLIVAFWVGLIWFCLIR